MSDLRMMGTFKNHSCRPNCVALPVCINERNVFRHLVAIFSATRIAANEEISISYYGQKKPKYCLVSALSSWYGPDHLIMVLCDSRRD